MDVPTYCLDIVLGTAGSKVWGPKADLRPAFEKFQGKEWDEGEKVVIKGHCNNASCDELIVCARLERVDLMALYLDS